MISLSKIDLILLIAVTSSIGILLSMESNDITIVNFLENRSVHAQISHNKVIIPFGIAPETFTRVSRSSPNGKTSLTLFIMAKGKSQKAEKEIKLELEKDQNNIAVSNHEGKFIIQDHNNQQILATL
jgi:hypothetical protein